MRAIFPIIIFIIFFVSLFLLEGIYLPKSSTLSEGKLFSIKRGQNLFQISENLEREGLIKNKYFFDFFVLIQGKARKLQAGEYELDPVMNIAEIAKKIISGQTLKIKITIPEGSTLREIQAKLSENFPRPDLGKDKIEGFSADFSFLKDLPKGASLEGFLFPDTYYFSPEMTDKEIIQKFFKNFDQRLTPDLREEIERQGKTIFEIVTMASLIEKEVKTKEDKKLVSGILWKRLKNGIPLQVDATITYITGKKTTKISKEETQIDSPYNTYKYLGLPKGPICNPSLESIIAAVYPKSSEYWYYLSTPQGETIFSKTLKDHNLAKAKYLK